MREGDLHCFVVLVGPHAPEAFMATYAELSCMALGERLPHVRRLLQYRCPGRGRACPPEGCVAEMYFAIAKQVMLLPNKPR